MVRVVAVTEAVKSLAAVESRFDLGRSPDERFFGEWQGNLPQLTEQ